MKREVAQGFFCLVLGLLCTLWGCQAGHVNGLQQAYFSEPAARHAVPEHLLGPQAKASLGEQRVLMVPVRFPGEQPRFSLDSIKERAVSGLCGYVREQSYGRTWVEPEFMGWVSLPDPLSRYRVSANNFKVDRSRVRKLIEDTLSAVEGRVDVAQYDHILIIPGVWTVPGKGYGMMCYCANPGMLTGVRGNPRFVTLRSRSGKGFSGGVFVGTENSPLGFFAHDFFHALGGVQANKRLVP
jgi:hypothetical protein